jgi:uncharacterized protein YdhG (YjbR/CyaY superfamily)
MKKTGPRASGPGPRSAPPVPAYIASVRAEARPALRQLRKEIRTTMPEAEELISYGVPAYKVNGRLVLGFGAAKAHCSVYVMSPAVMRSFAARLRKYKVTKGAIRFLPEMPLPASLIRALVKARLAENGSAGARR